MLRSRSETDSCFVHELKTNADALACPWSGQDLDFWEAGESCSGEWPSVSYQQQLMRSHVGREEEMKTSVRPSSHRRRKVDYCLLIFFGQRREPGCAASGSRGSVGVGSDPACIRTFRNCDFMNHHEILYHLFYCYVV